MIATPPQPTVKDLLQKARDRKKPPKRPDIADLIQEANRLRAATRLLQCPFCSHRTWKYPEMHRHITSRHPRPKNR